MNGNTTQFYIDKITEHFQKGKSYIHSEIEKEIFKCMQIDYDLRLPFLEMEYKNNTKYKIRDLDPKFDFICPKLKYNEINISRTTFRYIYNDDGRAIAFSVFDYSDARTNNTIFYKLVIKLGEAVGKEKVFVPKGGVSQYIFNIYDTEIPTYVGYNIGSYMQGGIPLKDVITLFEDAYLRNLYQLIRKELL